MSDWEEIEEEQTVQATELVEVEEAAIEMRDGQAVQVKRIVTREQPVFDELPVVDEAGNPVVIEHPATRRHPAWTEQVVHRVPRMVTKMVTVRKPVSHEGRRTHWGFLSQEVKAVFDGLGMDFGGYVRTKGGLECLRPDQMIPILCKAIQELAAKVATLEANHV